MKYFLFNSLDKYSSFKPWRAKFEFGIFRRFEVPGWHMRVEKRQSLHLVSSLPPVLTKTVKKLRGTSVDIHPSGGKILPYSPPFLPSQIATLVYSLDLVVYKWVMVSGSFLARNPHGPGHLEQSPEEKHSYQESPALYASLAPWLIPTKDKMGSSKVQRWHSGWLVLSKFKRSAIHVFQ